MFTLQRPLLHLDNGHVYTTGPGLHLDVSTQQEPLLLLDEFTVKKPELHLGVFRLK